MGDISLIRHGDLSRALHALNAAAYAAAKAARDAGDARANQLKRMALDTDALVDAFPVLVGVSYGTTCNRQVSAATCTGIMVDDGGGNVVCPKCFATHGKAQ